MRLGTVHRLILINPATAFRNLPLLVLGSFLPEFVPSFFYRFSTLGFADLLLAAEHVAVGDRQSLLAAMQKLSPQTVAWRLQLLRDLDVARLPLEQLDIPVLLMAGERDRLLPSVEEIQRLAQRLAPGSNSLFAQKWSCLFVGASGELGRDFAIESRLLLKYSLEFPGAPPSQGSKSLPPYLLSTSRPRQSPLLAARPWIQNHRR
ncbi:MAG: hypothetical protein HC857_05255 [Synechococcales cyanobacterium RU_4_20]|nr:hypothetical protein [Synechococcales cyanobacterium RU_4_20]